MHSLKNMHGHRLIPNSQSTVCAFTSVTLFGHCLYVLLQRIIVEGHTKLLWQHACSPDCTGVTDIMGCKRTVLNFSLVFQCAVLKSPHKSLPPLLVEKSMVCTHVHSAAGHHWIQVHKQLPVLQINCISKLRGVIILIVTACVLSKSRSLIVEHDLLIEVIRCYLGNYAE